MVVRLTLVAAARAAGVPAGVFPQDEPADPAFAVPTVGRFDRLLTAPERRARETVAGFGTEAQIDPALADNDFGTWRGRGLDQIMTADPAGAAAWIGDPDAAPHGGESLTGLLARVGNWFGGFEMPGHTVAVTHPALIRAALVHVLLAPPAGFWRIDVEPLSVTDLRYQAGRWTVRSIGMRSIGLAGG